MNELKRLAYLQAMGIPNFMPRKLLPNAPRSKACTWHPQQWAAELAQELALEWRLLDDTRNPLYNALPQSPSPKEESTQAVRDASQITFEKPSKILTPKPSVEVTSSGSDNDTAQLQKGDNLLNNLVEPLKQSRAKQGVFDSHTHNVIPRFALSIWRISSDWLIMDSRHSELALPTEAFLRNIIRVFSLGEHLPETQIFRWPMLKDPLQARRFGKGLNQDSSAAKEAIEGFLDEELVLNPAKNLWLMGDEARTFLLPPDALERVNSPVNSKGKNSVSTSNTAPIGYLQQPVSLSDWNIKVFCSPSLSDLLLHPEKKLELWQQWHRRQ